MVRIPQKLSTLKGSVYSVRNGESLNMLKIDWFKGGPRLADISSKNVGEHDLNPRMIYITVRLEN